MIILYYIYISERCYLREDWLQQIILNLLRFAERLKWLLRCKNPARHDEPICGSASTSSSSERTDTVLESIISFQRSLGKVISGPLRVFRWASSYPRSCIESVGSDLDRFAGVGEV